MGTVSPRLNAQQSELLREFSQKVSRSSHESIPSVHQPREQTCGKKARGGGVLDISLGGEVRLGPSYAVKTKIADFPTLFKTEFRFLIPSLRHS